MHNDPPILQCPNYYCQALNPESHRFCANCRTLLPKRFLWMIGAETVSVGSLVGDRYLVKRDRIVLDTKPGSAPEMPTDITPIMEPYLRLVPYRLHAPHLYAVVQNRILLLESAPIYPEGARSARGDDLTGQLMPAIAQVWQRSNAVRQLNLLWQWAQLWEPFCLEKVASSLLHDSRLRVDDGTLKVVELVFDQGKTPTLADLGQVWSQWLVEDEISEFFRQVCQSLLDEQITTGSQLMAVLDQGLTVCGQQQTRQIRFATFTDQGPSRQSNEDACYPTSGMSLSNEQASPLVIVCDGIGGHEGGEVASQLAIQTIAEHAKPIQEDQPSAIVTEILSEAIFSANDIISERNDAEQRQERQRMGTTVVLGLAHAHEFYISHVGDSRAYRVTRTGCHQVTLDDDVASREVRLGYTLYREALQHPAAGSLVQALGMGSSNYLHPTIQRFVLDEDCVFLLCSDGLSDNDLVDEYWQSDLVPILDGKLDVATAARKLVDIANTRNGHDNVTVGVIHCRVKARTKVTPSIPAEFGQPTEVMNPTTELQTAPPSTILQTQLTKSSNHWFSIALTLVGLLALGGILAVLLVPEIRNTVIQAPSSQDQSFPTVAPVPTVTELSQGGFIQVSWAASGVPLLNNPPEGSNEPTPQGIIGQIPPGTLLQVVTKQQTAPNEPVAVRLKVCSPGKPPAGATSTNWVTAGEIGWQQERAIAAIVNPTITPQPNQLGACAPNPSPISPPSPASSEN